MLTNRHVKGAICTWFVADTPTEATYFPQIGSRSDSPKARETYWRCVACFFASSVVHNPLNRHILFTNAMPPKLGNLDLCASFDTWGVEVIYLPVTYRLPSDRVQNWGNQFYILDVIDFLAQSGDEELYMIFDSDSVWIQSAAKLVGKVTEFGVITYTLGEKEYPPGANINGRTRAQIADFLTKTVGIPTGKVEYHGGEIFAANIAEIRKIAAQIPNLWNACQNDTECAPLEEAHFLSAVYAINGYSAYTANSFIKRIWTTFKHNNVSVRDFDLTIWHLPSEKNYGFRYLYSIIEKAGSDVEKLRAILTDTRTMARSLGIPRRTPKKFVLDVLQKFVEKSRLESHISTRNIS